jgi:hypothetical protein
MTAIGRGSVRTPRSGHVLAGVCGCLLAALTSPAAFADELYGQVRLGANPARGGTLEFRRAGSPGGTVTVGIAPDGSYRVFLEPGRYEARLTEGGARQPVGVTSLPAPIRQDLVFR